MDIAFSCECDNQKVTSSSLVRATKENSLENAGFPTSSRLILLLFFRARRFIGVTFLHIFTHSEWLPKWLPEATLRMSILVGGAFRSEQRCSCDQKRIIDMSIDVPGSLY